MQITLSNRAYVAVMSETFSKMKTETGGVLLGCRQDETWYVIESIDPGPESIFQPDYFEYDQKYIEHLINKTSRMYQEKLNLVGIWHRHPDSVDKFSSTDDSTNGVYARLTPDGTISILVNIDPVFRMTPYYVSWPLRYTKITYEVGDNLIPSHLLKFKYIE